MPYSRASSCIAHGLREGLLLLDLAVPLKCRFVCSVWGARSGAIIAEHYARVVCPLLALGREGPALNDAPIGQFECQK